MYQASVLQYDWKHCHIKYIEALNPAFIYLILTSMVFKGNCELCLKFSMYMYENCFDSQVQKFDLKS